MRFQDVVFSEIMNLLTVHQQAIISYLARQERVFNLPQVIFNYNSLAKSLNIHEKTAKKNLETIPFIEISTIDSDGQRRNFRMLSAKLDTSALGGQCAA